MACPRCESVGTQQDGGFFCQSCHACFFEKKWIVHADHLIEPGSTDTSLILRRQTRPDIGSRVYLVLYLMVIALASIDVARHGFGFRSLASVVLVFCAAMGLLGGYSMIQGAFGRVILSFAPNELRVQQRPALLSLPLAIPSKEIQSIWVRGYEGDTGRSDTYALVVQRDRWGTERLFDGVPDMGALVALAELIGSRIGVKCDTRSRELTAVRPLR